MPSLALPNQIPPQSASWGKVDAQGNLTIDVNVWLFLYNIALQIIAPAAGSAVASPGDMIALSETDNEAADLSITNQAISSLAGLESVDSELVGSFIPGLIASITNAVLLNLEPLTISAADVAPYVPSSTSPLSPSLGGTGINNGSKTITLGAALITTGAGAPTMAFSAAPHTYTFPAVNGSLITTGDTGTVSNLMLANSSITIGSTAIALGATAASIAGLTAVGALTVGAPAAQALSLQSNATTNATLDTSGNLLFGVTSLALANANAIMLNPVNGLGYLMHASGTASGASYAAFVYNAGIIGSITQSGTTAVLYNTTSDRRLKDIDGPVMNSGEFIDSLRPVTGSWKADGSPFTGFLADEYQRADPSSVVGTPGAVDESGDPILQQMEYGSSAWCAHVTAELQSLRQRLAAADIP